jgi:hypothetical protein
MIIDPAIPAWCKNDRTLDGILRKMDRTEVLYVERVPPKQFRYRVIGADIASHTLQFHQHVREWVVKASEGCQDGWRMMVTWEPSKDMWTANVVRPGQAKS